MICIYHKNCADGFTSAWVVNKYMSDVHFIPAAYGDPVPDVEGQDVIMVDFSYKRPVLQEMTEKANSVTILDHHKTAESDLKDLPGVTTVFDMNQSGAGITWRYFFPDTNPPQLLLHVEDRDLWRFTLPNTREIQAALFSYPYEFDTWDMLMSWGVSQLAEEGRTLERKHFKDVHELLTVVTRRMNIGGYNVPVANLPHTMTSDAGHIMVKNGEPFAACYWDTPTARVFSLRSTDAGVDVSEIAKQYGGGGHRNASGFRISFADAMQFEVPA